MGSLNIVPSRRHPAWAAWTALGAGAALLGWYILYTAPTAEISQAFLLFYQPFIPVLVMLWCWGIAVRYWEQHGVRYAACFTADDARKLSGSAATFHTATVLTSVFAASAAAFTVLVASGNERLAILQPRLAYAAVVAFCLFPGTQLYGESRRFFGRTAFRVLLPFQSVSWADFLLADCVTSLSKSVADAARGVCAVAADTSHGGLAALGPLCAETGRLFPLGLALPYIIRFVQCLRVYRETGNRGQFYNAIKYSTMFPVVLLAASAGGMDPAVWRATLRPVWIAASLVNSCYSYFWDVERDWEIGFFSQMGVQGRLLPTPALSSPSIYPRPFYFYLMASNLVLRFAWCYKLNDSLKSSPWIVLGFAVLEVVRRFQWMFVRVEVELRKLQALRPDHASPRAAALGSPTAVEAAEAALGSGKEQLVELQEGKGVLQHKQPHVVPGAHQSP